ncbi:MAG: substrate-binding domain-containing protein [Akkermansiaceae bacterium]
MNKPTKPNILYIGASEGFFSREILRGILSMRSEGCDWNFWCLPPDSSLDDLKNCLQLRHIDGIIARGLPEEIAKYISALSLSCVFIRAGEDESAAYINGPHPDDEMIGKLAGQAFSLLNLSHWGFVHWRGVMWSEARRNFFQNHAEACGVKNEILALDKKDQLRWSAVKEIATWLESLPKPCGILACNDRAGLDVLQACQMLELRVPDDIAVIGVDNDRLLCESSTVSLSSIDLKAATSGRAAAVQLGKMLGLLEAHITPPANQASYIVRQSSQKVDNHQLIYQKSLDYISSRPLRNIKVTELAKACGVSRRSLERAFAGCKSDSPATVIRQSRVETIIELLQEKSSSIESIAGQAGFSDAAGLSNFVKRITGKNPGAFRR